VRHSGYVDGYFGGSAQLDLGDRRLQINSGPFALAPGDTQEAVIACIGGSGSDRLSSVSVMKYLTKCVRQAFPSSALAIEPAPAAPAAPQPPSYYSLSPGFPNPFAGSTSFAYTVPKAEQIHLAIFDLLGREIVVLEDRALPAGEYRARWNGRDQKDRTLPSGVYFCRLQAAGYVEITHKVVLVRN